MDKNLSSLKVEDFSGGKTDFVLGGDANKAEEFDNFILTEKGDLMVRPGSELKYEVRIGGGDVPKNILDNRGTILLQAGKSVYSISGVTATEIVSPQSHSVFVGSINTIEPDFTYWNRHNLAVSQDLKSPQKIYLNDVAAWETTTLGLPDPLYATCIALANEIKAQYQAHRVDVTQHLVADNTNTISAANASNMDTLFALVDELKTDIQAHFDDAASGTPTYHTATFDRDITTATPDNLEEIYTLLVEMRTDLNTHDNGDAVHTLQNLHQVAATFLSPTTTSGAGAETFIYGVYFQYRYTSGDLEFLERSPIHLWEVTNLTGTKTVSRLPVLASGALENWDDASVTKVIVRSTNGGSTLFELAEVSSATTSYSDTTSDATLQLNNAAYTEGGVLDDERPPPAKFVEAVGDVIFFGGVKENRLTKANRLRASKPGAPYSSPADFFLDFEDDIMGLGGQGQYCLTFLKKAFYRVEGSIDSLGRGSLVKRAISTQIGCVSNRSIVSAKNGVYFAGGINGSFDGFYWTDGFTFKKISHDINLTAKTLADPSEICGAYDALRNRALWGCKSDENADSNDTIFVAFLDYKTNFDGHPFFTWSGGRNADNFTASALAYVNGELLRADYRGYLMVHDDDTLTDPLVDTGLSPASWYTETVFYTYQSVGFHFGFDQVRKWVPKMCLNADNSTSISVNIETANDDSGVFVELNPVVRQVNPEWGDPSIIWLVTDLRWNYNPTISEWRWMKAADQALRCMYKQIKFSNAYVEVDNSDIIGPASVDGTANTVTLLDAAEAWVTDPVQYYISFDTDAYATEYKITAISGDVLTVEDVSNNLTTDASANWKIYGYKKREVFNLLNYTVAYQVITNTQETVRD